MQEDIIIHKIGGEMPVINAGKSTTDAPVVCPCCGAVMKGKEIAYMLCPKCRKKPELEKEKKES